MRKGVILNFVHYKVVRDRRVWKRYCTKASARDKPLGTSFRIRSFLKSAPHNIRCQKLPNRAGFHDQEWTMSRSALYRLDFVHNLNSVVSQAKLRQRVDDVCLCECTSGGIVMKGGSTGGVIAVQRISRLSSRDLFSTLLYIFNVPFFQLSYLSYGYFAGKPPYSSTRYNP